MGTQLMEIAEITKDKAAICRDIMTALSDWFTEPAVIDFCSEAVETLPMFGWVEDGAVLGFVALKDHPPSASEIIVIGVRPECRGKNIGRQLIAAAERHARARGRSLLTVKTLADRGLDEPHYAATRAFYRANGFIAAEVFPTLWHPDSPCLFQVKPLPVS
ncbi:GNAT family N-acetyltransferase [Paracoccus siganidrum]|uniref:N-acetyltransferase n=1 Tax=Paracoccus siganidrum TaxID=1276757 RepID=A0A419A6E1_9RHOB|nr:GNAT family N-acetyltransferase [Paracoccus siganidrum]RJL13069.1 N-acetyltransferase [Paracoccus siganidrum]RMC33025.1 GNAT family N-acetyltransferase [Paracoccus siganidrum]